MKEGKVNIVEQRYDFLVDVNSFAQLDAVCLKRLLHKLYGRHKGWLYNWLYYKLDITNFDHNQLETLNDAALRLYGKALL
jgi:hypothetical protein